MGTGILIDIAIFILWSIICFTIGRAYGRSEQWEDEDEDPQ